MKQTQIGLKQLKLAEKFVLCAVFAAILTISGKPTVARADSLFIPSFESDTAAAAELPVVKPQVVTVKKTITSVATAYSSDVAQTDSSPFTTSNGKQVYDGLVAANWLPYNTKIRMPDLFGDKIFTVNDRMNPRYDTGRLDVWMKSRGEAMDFGLRHVRIQIVEVE